MRRQRFTARLQTGAGPEHAGGLALRYTAKIGSAAAPAPLLRRRLRMGKTRLHIADGAPDGAVTKGRPLQRSRHSGNEGVAIGGKESGGGVGNGEKLRLA